MRTWIARPIALLAMALATAAAAAPTCRTANGTTTRCGVAGAMPVGWRQPAGERLAQRDDGPTVGQLATLVIIVGGVIAIIALMPKFDGDWEPRDQEPRDLR